MAFLECFMKIAEQCDGKDLALKFAPSTRTWHATVGNAWRGSSTVDEGAMLALTGALAAYQEHKQRKAEKAEREGG